MSDTTFTVHGVYGVSNAISIEIEVSDDNEAIRGRRWFHDGTQQISDWAELEYSVNDDGEDELTAKNVCGFDIDFNQVMRVPKTEGDN